MAKKRYNTQKTSYFGRTLLTVSDPRYEKFYKKLVAGTWEPETFEFLKKNLDKSTKYLDIGSWIGITPMWASHLAEYVLAVEPEPYCSEVIEQLIADNKLDNIVLLNGALTNEPSVDLALHGGEGSSASTLLKVNAVDRVTVRGFSARDILSKLGAGRRVIKIDIEGHEYDLVEMLGELGGPETKAIQLAIHPQILEKSLSLGWPMRRIKTISRTYGFLTELGMTLGAFQIRGFRSIASYILFGVALKRKPVGTEIEFDLEKVFPTKNARQ